ncbi:hypothetical protein DIE21_03620 [Burkholderia sp. Bp9140]|nr:hypothetical protein DIE21_03620 [Burkholderia sp. Bp9140]
MRLAGTSVLLRLQVRFGDETAGRSVRQGFRERGNFGAPRSHARHPNGRGPNSRFRYSGKP